MCTYKELKDGTYNIRDLEMMNQMIELSGHIKSTTHTPPTGGQ